jgi:hypothetical protein
MKAQFHQKNGSPAAAVIEQKHSPTRSGTKASAHRYERRKIREQLRRLDWALAGED